MLESKSLWQKTRGTRVYAESSTACCKCKSHVPAKLQRHLIREALFINKRRELSCRFLRRGNASMRNFSVFSGNENIKQTSDVSEEYFQNLKQKLLVHTTITGVALTLYFLLIWSEQAALGAAIGASASYFYLSLLEDEVENLPLDYMPIVCLPMKRSRQKYPPEVTFSTSEEVDNNVERALLQIYGVFSQALKPRMLLVVAFGPLVSLSGMLTHGNGIPLSTVVLGFSCYKIALLVQVWNSVKVLLVPKFDVDDFLQKYEE